ncbi:MAG: sigma 54-interacting transcriptional regulator [Acidobacteriota bacterium]
MFVLDPGESQLGALESNAVVLPLAGVSRVHARLRLDPANGRLHLEDLASKNGTFIDGRRIDRGVAESGAELRFGPVGLRFETFHEDDAKLAISFEYAPDQTHAFPIQEVQRKTGTHVSSLSRQWLVLAEAFQDRLLRGDGDDLTPALAMLREEMQLDVVSVLELPEERDPVVVHAVGRMDDSAARELRDLLAPLRSQPPVPDLYYDTVQGNQGSPLTVVATRPPGGDPLVLAFWGRFPGRLDSELFMRLLIRMIEARRPEPVADGEDRAREYPGLIVPPDYVYGRSEAMRQIYDLMQTLAQGDLPVLIIGETGVGKEYLAQILHESSPRRRGPFAAINCAAIPADLLEAELFGIGEGVATGVSARKGRFQLADGGTLFLDEIGDMSADLQAKLLRALQEKEVHPLGKEPIRVDVRVLGATNQDLSNRIHDGSFRADLYYRLAGYVLEIPPLRERSEDVPPLVEHFVRQCAEELGRSVRGLTVHALRLLTEYPWPGNVRELSNEVRRAVYLCPDHRTIESATLSKTIRQHYASLPDASEDSGARSSLREDSKVLSRPIGLSLDSLDLDELESRAIEEALRRCEDNQVQAAKLLGISRQKLRRRMEKMGVLKSAKAKDDAEQD